MPRIALAAVAEPSFSVLVQCFWSQQAAAAVNAIIPALDRCTRVLQVKSQPLAVPVRMAILEAQVEQVALLVSGQLCPAQVVARAGVPMAAVLMVAWATILGRAVLATAVAVVAVAAV